MEEDVAPQIGVLLQKDRGTCLKETIHPTMITKLMTQELKKTEVEVDLQVAVLHQKELGARLNGANHLNAATNSKKCETIGSDEGVDHRVPALRNKSRGSFRKETNHAAVMNLERVVEEDVRPAGALHHKNSGTQRSGPSLLLTTSHWMSLEKREEEVDLRAEVQMTTADLMKLATRELVRLQVEVQNRCAQMTGRGTKNPEQTEQDAILLGSGVSHP